MTGGINIKRLALLQMMILIITSGCSSVESFHATIDSISKNELVVDCTDEINKGKKEANSVGYLCTVGIHDSTAFKDSTGNPLRVEDFSAGDYIRITLSKPQPVSEESRRFDASEIILITNK